MEDFKKDIDNNTLTLGDFNSPLSKMDRSSKQNVNKDTVALNNALNQMDLTECVCVCVCTHTHISFHANEAKYIFFSNTHGIFSKIDHMIQNKPQKLQEK